MIKLSFCQNDSLVGESFWQKHSLITLYVLFELWLTMVFSPPERKLAKRTSVHCIKDCRILEGLEGLEDMGGQGGLRIF